MRRSGVSDAYDALLDKVHWSRQHGRDVLHLNQTDIDRARLFAYGYRSQTIGTFHATRTAVESAIHSVTNSHTRSHLTRATILLTQLEDEAIQIVPQDFRAALSTLYRYDQWTSDALELIQTAMACEMNPELEPIGRLFSSNLDSVIGTNGLYIANDTHVPQQGAFPVPNLGITIVPIIYGDFHSWNFAYLPSNQSGVPIHRHRAGAEIHLGRSRVNGFTVLGNCQTDVQEGYAMPIPPTVEHGFYNRSGHDHILPFVFGSLSLGGWGIFFDVEPRQEPTGTPCMRELGAPDMNGSVWLDRAVERIERADNNTREIVVSATRTSTTETGGLELSAARVGEDGVEMTCSSFRIVSVVKGKGKIRIGAVEAEVGE
ncbi:MAG: hypothetical protein JO185_18685, partial [Acidobacteriaceae bacterium]|nr:hypothetical protein [Acidobacteriaceae bacterium]